MDWTEHWTQHIAARGRKPDSVEEFWERFVGSLIAALAAYDDWGSDYTNPERIEVGAGGGSYMTLEFNRLSEAINVVYAVQRPKAYGLCFRIQMLISDSRCVMKGFAVDELKTSEEAAAIVFNRQSRKASTKLRRLWFEQSRE